MHEKISREVCFDFRRCTIWVKYTDGMEVGQPIMSIGEKYEAISYTAN